MCLTWVWIAELFTKQVSGILVCEAGCILENLDTFVGTKGWGNIFLHGLWKLSHKNASTLHHESFVTRPWTASQCSFRPILVLVPEWSEQLEHTALHRSQTVPESKNWKYNVGNESFIHVKWMKFSLSTTRCSESGYIRGCIKVHNAFGLGGKR